MAHFALLDENNIVVMVLAGRDQDNENELTTRTGQTYKQTSYNTFAGIHKLNGIPFRKNYAGIGYLYDEQLDAFIPPKNFNSWVLNQQTCQWDPPIPYPEDYYDIGVDYRWDENSISWRRDTPETNIGEV